MSERDPFQELLDESRHREALAERARERSLEAQLREEARFIGMLRDLSEQDVVVTVRTESGDALQGWLRGVALDHVVVRQVEGPAAYVSLGAITDVRPETQVRQGPAASERDASVDRTLAEVLARAAEDRPRVRFRLRGQGDATAGTLIGVGADVASVRLDGDGGVAYVRIAAVTAATIID